MICGNFPAETSHFPYRSSFYITRFFQDADTDFEHDGSTRGSWVANTLEEILNEPSRDANTPPDSFIRVIVTLMDKGDAKNEGSDRTAALTHLNVSLSREGFEAFFGDDGQCYLRHTETKTIAGVSTNPHRPFSAAELKRRENLSTYLDEINEDGLIEEVLLPLFRQLGFHRITAAGHKDKALEYGKDVPDYHSS